MNWEQAKELPLGYPWSLDDLRQSFHAVWGGVAYPGKNPGFAVVAGLRPIQQKDIYEIHVLGEAESPDLGDLLRQCRGLASTYYIRGLAADKPFQWVGDWKNTAGQRIILEQNQEGQCWSGRDRLMIGSTPILDMEQPYLYMVAKLKEYLRGGHKQLFLKGSRVVHYLTEIGPEDVSDLKFGAYPAVEALAFVVVGLRDHAEQTLRARMYPPRPQRDRNDLFRRDRFYNHRR